MTLEQIKSEAELYLASLQDEILPLQETYIGNVGKYWQGAGTPDPPPEDGAVGIPDPDAAISGLPSWSAFGATLPFSAPFAVRCDELKYPPGTRGFSLVTYFIWGNGIWSGSLEYRVDAWESLAWTFMTFPQ